MNCGKNVDRESISATMRAQTFAGFKIDIPN
jgi:hypothetical protein